MRGYETEKNIFEVIETSGRLERLHFVIVTPASYIVPG